MNWPGFTYIGVAATGIVVLAVVAILALLFWAYFLHDRFGLIFFRKGHNQRRLSIASWWNSKIMSKEFRADCWPINDRPFYLSYRLGKRRLFILAGSIPDRPRHGAISGKHPNETERESE